MKQLIDYQVKNNKELMERGRILCEFEEAKQKLEDMEIEEECLVSEAQEKCQCDFCKQMREFTRISLEQYAKLETMRIIIKTLEEIKKEDCKVSLSGETKKGMSEMGVKTK
jgi:hypothetical protein